MNAGSKLISFITEGLPWKITVNNWSIQKKQREQRSSCIKKERDGVTAVDWSKLITRHLLVRAKGEVFGLLYVCLFGQRLLDNPRADSRQSSRAGVLWVRMCLLPFWGRKRGAMKFSLLYGSQWGIFALWWFLSDISATRARIHTKFYLYRDNVCLRASSRCGVQRPWVGGRWRGVKNSKNGGWSHSCIGQLPFLFFSALPNVVQYVGHRPALILV